MKNKVLNKRNGKIPADAVYIGRPSKCGNLFKIGQGFKSGIPEIDRKAAVEAYRKWLEMRLAVEPDFLLPLKGKDLVCWCSPLPCHGDIILEFANKDTP